MTMFFDYPVNFRRDIHRNFTVSGAVETPNNMIADNNYETTSDATSFAFKTHGILENILTDITHIFIKGKNIANYTISVPSGHGTGTSRTRTIPTTVRTWEGENIETTINGFQNDLYDLHIPVAIASAQSLTGAITVANNLTSFPNQTDFEITLQLANAALTSDDTAGQITINYIDPNDDPQVETIAYRYYEVENPKIVDLEIKSITSITATGFSTGTITVSTKQENNFNCSKVALSITGTNAEIAEVMLLNLRYQSERNYFIIDPSFHERQAGHHRNTSGEVSAYNAGNGARGKWEVQYGLRINTRFGYREFLNFKQSNLNFGFAMDPYLYPDRVFLATWGEFITNIQDTSRVIENSMEMRFEVWEK